MKKVKIGRFVGVVCDLLWAEPSATAKGFTPSDRGTSYKFGRDIL